MILDFKGYPGLRPQKTLDLFSNQNLLLRVEILTILRHYKSFIFFIPI